MEAIVMAQEGRWDDLNAYCHDDVSILCALYRKKHLKNPRKHETIDLTCIAHNTLYSSEGMVRRLDNISKALTLQTHTEQVQEVQRYVVQQDHEAQEHKKMIETYMRHIKALTSKVKKLEHENEQFEQIFADF